MAYLYISYHWVKKGFSWLGNNIETTWKPQVTTIFPHGFHSGNSKITCGFLRRKHPGFPSMETCGIPVGKYMETPGS